MFAPRDLARIEEFQVQVSWDCGLPISRRFGYDSYDMQKYNMIIDDPRPLQQTLPQKAWFGRDLISIHELIFGGE